MKPSVFNLLAMALLLVGFVVPAHANDYAKNNKLKGHHINGILEQWGSPTSKKGNKYQWKECAYTGYVITNCTYGNCRSHKETGCCYQNITTDNQGIITKYSQRGEGMCFHGVNYDKLALHGKDYHGVIYGVLGMVDIQGQAQTFHSLQLNENTAIQDVHRLCGGKCQKVYTHHNSCIATASPLNVNRIRVKDMFVGVHQDRDLAKQKAVATCEKTFGEGQCSINEWRAMGTQVLCAEIH